MYYWDAFWGWCWGTPTSGGGSGGTVNAPEIDASVGLLALAAIAATMLLVWERRRRAMR